eukprot:COSAG06_NODE_24496_length_661_cov_0.610320_2_plen_77_part_01
MQQHQLQLDEEEQEEQDDADKSERKQAALAGCHGRTAEALRQESQSLTEVQRLQEQVAMAQQERELLCALLGGKVKS